MVYLGSNFIPGYVDPRSRYRYPPQSGSRYPYNHHSHSMGNSQRNRGPRGHGRQPPVFTRRQPPHSTLQPGDRATRHARDDRHADNGLDQLPMLMVTVPSPTPPQSPHHSMASATEVEEGEVFSSPPAPGALASLDGLMAFKQSVDTTREKRRGREHAPGDLARIAQTFLKSRSASADSQNAGNGVEERGEMVRQDSPHTREARLKAQLKKRKAGGGPHDAIPVHPKKSDGEDSVASRSTAPSYAQTESRQSRKHLAPPSYSRRPSTPPLPSDSEESERDRTVSLSDQGYSRASYDSRQSRGSFESRASHDSHSLLGSSCHDDRWSSSDRNRPAVDRKTSWQTTYNLDVWPTAGNGNGVAQAFKSRNDAVESIKTNLRILKAQIDAIEKQIPALMDPLAESSYRPISPKETPVRNLKSLEIRNESPRRALGPRSVSPPARNGLNSGRDKRQTYDRYAPLSPPHRPQTVQTCNVYRYKPYHQARRFQPRASRDMPPLENRLSPYFR